MNDHYFKTPVNPTDFDFFKVFEAPACSNKREPVISYMNKMSGIKWTPKESFHIGWKVQGDFNVSLQYDKGNYYYGVPYARTKCALNFFESWLEKDGTYEPNSVYYEETIGNNCSISMCMAYQQIINFPVMPGGYKPCEFRGDALRFPGNIVRPDIEGYDSEDVWQANDKEVILDAYSKLDSADILYYSNKHKSGHTRMVSKKGETFFGPDGKIDAEQSYLYVTEQTNAWDKAKKEQGIYTTWWVNKKYTFALLYEKKFMPVTLSIFDSDEKLEDAYLAFKGTNTPETIMSGVKGVISSNFPLNSISAVVRNEEGKKVLEQHLITFDVQLSCDLGEKIKLDFNSLPSGKYTFELTAGLARGLTDITKFEFTK